MYDDSKNDGSVDTETIQRLFDENKEVMDWNTKFWSCLKGIVISNLLLAAYLLKAKINKNDNIALVAIINSF